ncbi:MAG TPA: pilin [Patescibacteria group bacterium]|nr:pilin [Patescibacteria group bacterium]
MRILLTLQSFVLTALIFASQVQAQADDVSKVQNFMTNIIEILVTLAGILAALFFVWGGVGYITSTGNPENLEKSKKTIFYSAIGLAVTLGAYVLVNIVTQTAQSAFGQ